MLIRAGKSPQPKNIDLSRSYESSIGRRELLRLLGWGTICMTLGGCGSSEPDPELEKTLKFWGTATLDIGRDWHRLHKDLRVKVTFTDNHNDPGPVIAAMSKGTAAIDYDIGGLQGGAERELAEKNLIVPWDISKIPHWGHVWPWARDIRYTIYKGQRYGIPTVINADSMIYLEDKIARADSYAIMFDKALRGRVAMEDSWINSVIFTAIYLKENSLQTIRDPGNLTSDELGGVMEFLIRHKREGQFRTFWNGWEQGLQLIKDGEVWAMTGWEPIVYRAQQIGVRAKYAAPKEGYEGWSNDLLLHKGAVERGLVDEAHQFANWELSGFYGCALGESRGYVVPADTAIDFAQSNLDRFNPEHQKKLMDHVRDKFLAMKGNVYWQNVRPDEHRLYEDWWARLRAA